MTQETNMSQILDIGSQVLFRVGGSDDHPELRPAQVVCVWSQECANLVVAFDGWNDHKSRHKGEKGEFASDAEAERCVGWRTSVLRGDGVGQWRFPPVAEVPVEVTVLASSEGTSYSQFRAQEPPPERAALPEPEAKPKKSKASKPADEKPPAEADSKPSGDKPAEDSEPPAEKPPEGGAPAAS
jgi:hypothetical protein